MQKQNKTKQNKRSHITDWLPSGELDEKTENHDCAMWSYGINIAGVHTSWLQKVERDEDG